jgi:hypothetical protein
MTWRLANGSKLVLAYHTPEEWADAVRASLIYLGCSEEYAEQAALLIRTARP